MVSPYILNTLNYTIFNNKFKCKNSDVTLKLRGVLYNLDKGQNHAKEFKETFIDFYHSGQFITQLSEKYNVTHSTIYKSIDL